MNYTQKGASRCGTFFLFLTFLFGAVIFSKTHKGYAQVLTGKTGIEAKVALETSFENRLKRVLTEITGSEDIIVIVNVELSKEQSSSVGGKKESQNTDFILPGVPIREVVSEKNVQSAVMSALGEDTRTLIRKLKATIIIDKSVSDDTEKIIREVSAGLLGVDESRGDVLVVQRMRFKKQTFTLSSLFYPPTVFYMLGVLAFLLLASAISFFLFGYAGNFSKDFIGAVQTLAAAVRETGTSAVAPLNETEQESAVSLSREEMEPIMNKSSLYSTITQQEDLPPFSFISEKNLPALIFLLKKESPSTAAAVIGYLPPTLGSAVFAALDHSHRVAIASDLSQVRELSADETLRIEKEIKEKIRFVVGGAAQLGGLLETLNEETRNEMLSIISQKQSPDIADLVRRHIVTLDILANASADIISVVIKQFGRQAFAQILKNSDPKLKDKILDILPPGAAEGLKQEMELARPISAERLEIEKRRLVQVLKRLKARGLLAEGDSL